MILRNGIGALGLAFPLVLLIGAGLDHIQGSLSAYYHFSPANPDHYGAGAMRDAFVGMLCAIGAFLLFYRGYTLWEDLALNVAGIAAVLIALLPMDWPADYSQSTTTTAKLHCICAALFFVMIAYVCVFRARDTLWILSDVKQRKIFEWIYLVLGILMLATPATIFVLEVVLQQGQNSYATLMVEISGVFVFAAFWLIKSWEIRLSLRSDKTSAS